MWEKFLSENLKIKNFRQKLCHQVVEVEAVETEALRMEVEAIRALLLPHPALN